MSPRKSRCALEVSTGCPYHREDQSCNYDVKMILAQGSRRLCQYESCFVHRGALGLHPVKALKRNLRVHLKRPVGRAPESGSGICRLKPAIRILAIEILIDFFDEKPSAYGFFLSFFQALYPFPPRSLGGNESISFCPGVAGDFKSELVLAYKSRQYQFLLLINDCVDTHNYFGWGKFQLLHKVF